jgi:hypothetical protein
MTYEVFMVFWVMRQCSLIDGYQCFEKHIASIFTVEGMEAVGFSEMLITTYQTTVS